MRSAGTSGDTPMICVPGSFFVVKSTSERICSIVSLDGNSNSIVGWTAEIVLDRSSREKGHDRTLKFEAEFRSANSYSSLCRNGLVDSGGRGLSTNITLTGFIGALFQTVGR